MKTALASCFFLLTNFTLFAQKTEQLIINFNFDKYELEPQATTAIDSFFQTLKSSIDSVSLKGHTDSKGSNLYNDELSMKRVESTKKYIQSKTRVAIVNLKGYGETNLLNQDLTDEEGMRNRRVEITVFSKKESPVVAEKIIPQNKTLTNILQDTATQKGSVINLKNLEFENNSDKLLSYSVPTLEELYQVLVNNPTLEISIEGHICCVPAVAGVPYTQWPNFQISFLRAKRVYNYLVNKGIDPKRLEYKAFGSSRPLFPIPEKNEQESIANRRVEIRIISK